MPYTLKTETKLLYQKHIQKHFIQRILAPGRFSTITINDMLKRYGASITEINNENPKKILKRLMQSWDLRSMEQALNLIIETERLNSQIVGMSPCLSRFPFRITVRSIGISILTHDSIYCSLTKRYQFLASDVYQYSLLQ